MEEGIPQDEGPLDEEIPSGYKTPPPRRPVDQSGIVKNFKNGDLLYGLEKEARSKYIAAIERSIGHGALCTADRYNNQFLCTYAEKTLSEIKELMEKNKYREAVTQYSDDLTKNIKPGYFETKRSEEELFRRFCKDAIRYTIEHGGKIHSLLDELESGAIARKEEGLGTSFTASELRYIYRNWSKLKDHVFFYEGGELAPAPWETTIGREEWKQYAPKPKQDIVGEK